MSMEREEIHRLVDAVPEHKLTDIEKILKHAIENENNDPVRQALANAPFDDEPITDEERERIRHADEDLKNGRTTSMGDLKRELGL